MMQDNEIIIDIYGDALASNKRNHISLLLVAYVSNKCCETK